MSDRYIVYPEKYENINWQEIYNALALTGRKYCTKSIAVIEKMEKSKNIPIPGMDIFDEMISAETINNLLRACKLSYRLCSSQKNHSGRDTSKNWCIGRSQRIKKENRFQHLESAALLKEFIDLTSREKSADWHMCHDEVLRRLTS